MNISKYSANGCIFEYDYTQLRVLDLSEINNVDYKFIKNDNLTTVLNGFEDSVMLDNSELTIFIKDLIENNEE